MGIYINPEGTTKEEWLRDNLTWVGDDSVPVFEDTPKDCLLVCLVNNGPFTAAGVCYDKREYDAFTVASDRRQKIWCRVPTEKLHSVCPDLKKVIKEV